MPPTAKPRLVWAVMLAAAWLLFAGCATTEKQVALTGDILVDGPNAISNGPARDRVLWQYRTAAAALRRGDFDVAKQYLDDALRSIQGVYGPNSEARKSRGYFRSESRKTFIGEPYERSMAYFYRGVLYWRDGELDNARACFRSAEFEDSDAAEHAYSGDWVLPDYLDGFATTRLGGDGTDAFNRSKEHSQRVTLPPYNPADNVLLIVEYGPGPVKFATGEYAEELRFRAQAGPAVTVEVQADAGRFNIAPCDDVNFQATTRGGRVMDHVLANKAVFKKGTEIGSEVAIITGAVLASEQHHNSAADEVGVGLLAAGLVTAVASIAATPQADIRCWDNLPQYISFATLSLAPGEHHLTVNFLNGSGQALANLKKELTVHIGNNDAQKVIFVSDQSVTPQTL